MYTFEDLEKAKAELARQNERWENYSGNNPNKYVSDRRSARDKVEMIQEALKSAGQLPRSPQEVLEEELDHRFPDAKSKEIVEHNGTRYQRRFSPAEHSRRGKVVRWHRSWVAIPPTSE